MPSQSSTLVRGTHMSALVFGQAALPEEPAAPYTSSALESYPDFHAFYDTGEHAWPGEGLYPDQLPVGKAPGVLFSYGEIVAMGDLYDTVDDMMKADAGELATLKSLVQRNLAYYKGMKKNDALDVGDDEWQKVTHKRYLDLAEKNYEHFSPSFLFTDAKLHASDLLGRDHRSAWHSHHASAIAEAQRLALDDDRRKRSSLPVLALVINAFGDHFLTDAFASGHLLNKGEILAYFKAKFYSSPKSLSKAGEKFFEQLADAAWKRGSVAAKFSKVQSTAWHGADIDRPGRFAKVLKGAAEEEPDRIANFALKVLHDKLNKDGVDVENDAGNAWRLTGDGFLTDRTLGIMKLAVAQSAANIVDPSILASNLDVSRYQAKVWKYVPRLTAAARAKALALVTSWIDPASRDLLDGAAGIVERKVDLLIELTKKKHKLEAIDPAERARDRIKEKEAA
jgi:hypothetical protein